MAIKKLVRLPKLPDGPAFYRRAGLTLTRGADNIVDVTDQQLKVLLADPNLAIGDPPRDEPKK